MSLYLYNSNRLEILADAFNSLVSKNPLAPILPEIVVLQSGGMARWLSMQVAKKSGVCANLDCPFPNQFVDRIFRKVLGGQLPKSFDKDILQSQIQSLLVNRDLLKQRFGHDLGFTAREVTHSNPDEKLLYKAISIVEMNLQNPQFDVNTFVDKLGISRTLAYKKIKAISDKSINDFILSVRLKKAAQLLKETNRTISEVAMETGFADHSYFSAVFKKNFEISPSEFRQNGGMDNS